MLEDFPFNKMDNKSSTRRNNPKVIRKVTYGKEKNNLFINGEIVRNSSIFVEFPQKTLVKSR